MPNEWTELTDWMDAQNREKEGHFTSLVSTVDRRGPVVCGMVKTPNLVEVLIWQACFTAFGRKACLGE